jgi:hypothetical protein
LLLGRGAPYLRPGRVPGPGTQAMAFLPYLPAWTDPDGDSGKARCSWVVVPRISGPEGLY